MTGSKFLLDTNIISALLKGERSVANKIDSAKQIFIPIIALGELYYGAAYSSQVERNISDIERFAMAYEVAYIDKETTIAYGAIKAALRKKGKPIPENDIWIAAIAKRNKMPVVTRDKHFKEIDGLAVRKW